MPRALAATIAFLVACSAKPSGETEKPRTTVQESIAARALDAGVPAAPPDAAPEARANVRPEINTRFLDPNLDVEQWTKTFEGESREVYASRGEVVAAMELAPGQVVADVGAGTGFYLWEFARTVGPEGHAYGVEISPRFLDHLRTYVKTHGISNVTVIAGTERSVELHEKSVDAVFMCDTYHHFEYPRTTLASIRRALRPEGTLTIVDFERIEGKTANWLLKHVRAGKETVTREIEAAGFELIEEPAIKGFRENYMLRFRLGSNSGNSSN